VSAIGFLWDISQESKISELEDRVKKLEEQNEILYEWVQYFRNKEKENDTIP